MANVNSNKRNNRGKGRSMKNKMGIKVEGPETSSVQDTRPRHNDIAWYNANPELLKTAGSLSFNNALGVDIYHSLNNYDGHVGAHDEDITIPGIMALDLLPTIGIASDSAATVNVAARKIYSYVRHENSGHANYDAPDLMLYILAMDNLYSAYNWVTRIYGCLRLFSGSNRYFGEQLFHAMNVDYADIMQHGNDLYFNLLSWAARLKTFYIPSTMTYLTRHAWLYSQIFKDSPDPKSQVYLFNPTAFYTWSENGASAWSLIPIHVGRTKLSDEWTYDNIVHLMERMINGVATSEDFNIMSGDILKAYGSNTFTITPVDINYILEPTYSESVLTQIHNARVVDDVTLGSIKTDATNAIHNNTDLVSSEVGRAHNVVIDLHSSAPTPEEVMIATRLTPGFRQIVDGTTPKDEFYCYGSEIVTFMAVYDIATWKKGIRRNSTIPTDKFVKSTDSTNGKLELLSDLTNVMQFNQYPLMYRIEVGVNTTSKLAETTDVRFIASDLDNYTVVSVDTLKKLHDCALLSEFGITSGNN